MKLKAELKTGQQAAFYKQALERERVEAETLQSQLKQRDAEIDSLKQQLAEAGKEKDKAKV